MMMYQSRLRVMSEPLFFYELEHETGWSEIKMAIRNSVTPDKYERILNFFSYPLAITSIADDVISDINRVFHGRNANFQVQYPNKRFEQAGQELAIKLNTRNFIQKCGQYVLRCQPQTIVVVDKDEDGMPYYVDVNLKKLIGYQLTPCQKNFQYIIFHHSHGHDEFGEYKRIAFYDDEFYRVFEKRGMHMKMIIENSHNLGYCPARWFVDDDLNTKDYTKKWSPLATVLGTMSEWQQFHTYSYYAEHYGVFPVIEYASAVCEEEYCTNGKVSYPMENGEMSTPTDCPTCSKNQFTGPGTSIKVNPAIDNDENDARGYFTFISPPTENLRFEHEKQMQRENFIKVQVTGFNDMLNKEAVNTDQVKSLMEDRKKPLLKISAMLGRLHKWMVKTAMKLAYQMDVNVYANYGTEWFLMSESQLQKLFKDAKETGLPDSEISQIYHLLVETKYKNDPHLIQKLLIENNLNPAPFNTLEECYKKAEQGVMQMDDLYLKANFNKLIAKFERENGNLVDFGDQLTFESKIDIIYNTLIKYIKDEQTTENDSGQSIPEQGIARSDAELS